MLRHLHIHHVALIEECGLEFAPGMTAITGETGSGKSLLLESLSLLAGSRATPSLVRSGTDRATVEAVFDGANGSTIQQLLEEAGLDAASDGEIIVRREVAANGRSRAWINGRLVPVAQLQAIAGELIEMGGQHDQLSLLTAARQRELFDGFAGAENHLSAYRKAWQEHQSLSAKLDAMQGIDRERAQRADFLRFQVEELRAGELRVGELSELQEEVARLSHRERIMELGNLAVGALSESEPGVMSAIDLAGKALAAMEEAAEYDPALTPLGENLRQAMDLLSDTALDVARYLGRGGGDPERLTELNERLDLLKRLLRKHGPTEEEALDRLKAMEEELAGIDGWEDRCAELRSELLTAERHLEERARDLSVVREKSRQAFVRPLVAILRDFSLPKVRFEVSLTPVRQGFTTGSGLLLGPDGAEDVEFLFSANPGEPLQPLRRIASGGELSRIMLALRTMGAPITGGPLLVFDEVDAGISGAAARSVAERLAALGRNNQILAVTHNATVAAAADQHLLVEKRTIADRTITSARTLQGLQREQELARLLDGGKRSEKSMALAAELLSATA